MQDSTMKQYAGLTGIFFLLLFAFPQQDDFARNIEAGLMSLFLHGNEQILITRLVFVCVALILLGEWGIKKYNRRLR